MREPIALPLARDEGGILRSDWQQLLAMLTDDTRPAAQRAGIFHESLAQALVDQVTALAETERFDAVGLTGGVFQNRRLAERVAGACWRRVASLPSCLQTVPANDGGLAFGQLIESLYSANGSAMIEDRHITLAHGNGGRYMRELIEELFRAPSGQSRRSTCSSMPRRSI